jgi:adenine phosphoribosyltransferase
VEDYPIPGITFRDITSLLETPSAFAKACQELRQLSKAFAPTAVASIESRGFIFAGPIACDLSLPMVLARKPGKLPNDAYRKDFDLEYGSTSLEIQKNTALTAADRVVIIDDLIATGGTAIACAELLNERFRVPRENILVLALIDLPALGGSDLISSSGYNVGSIIEYR